MIRTTSIIIQRLRHQIPFLRRRIAHQPVSLGSLGTPLYELNPLPWWTRWTYFLVAADAVFTISASELIWNHWTTIVDVADTETGSSEPVFVLRPLWHRLAAITGQGLLGAYLGFMIVFGRGRIIRKLWILPANASSHATNDVAPSLIHSKQVFFQCINHRGENGQLRQFKACKLQEMDTTKKKVQRELLLKIDGVRGFYSLSLEGVRINGEQMTDSDQRGGALDFVWAKEELQDAWRAEAGIRRKFRPKFTGGHVEAMQ